MFKCLEIYDLNEMEWEKDLKVENDTIKIIIEMFRPCEEITLDYSNLCTWEVEIGY